MRFKQVKEKNRMRFLPTLAGAAHPTFERFVMDTMANANPAYKGGYWDFIEFPNGAKAMILPGESKSKIQIRQQANGFSGSMSPTSLSIALNISACSYLSFHTVGPTQRALSKNYHLLRETLDSELFDTKEIFRFLD